MVPYDSRNWFGHLFAVRGSAAPRIAWRVGTHAAWAVLIVLLHRRWPEIHMPSTVHTLIGIALGLLLVFRTNASYERFWEGRKAWGEIVNESRNIVRDAAAFLTPGSPAELAVIARWTSAFSHAAKHALRGGVGLGPAAAHLPPAAVAAAQAAPCPPLAVAVRLTAELAAARRAGKLFDQATTATDHHVARLLDAFGTCERIRHTPLPFAYVVHLRRALALYLVTLPFALVDGFGWYTVFDNVLVAYVLLGIEEIGVEIENPFGTDANDLPLEQLCERIDTDLAAFTAAAPTPEASSPAAV